MSCFNINIDEAAGLLRLEVQCYKDQIQSLVSKDFSLLGNTKVFFDPEVCKKVILDFYIAIIGKGKYLSLADAKELIDQSKLKSKNELKEVLELVNEKRSISNARISFNKMYNQTDNKKFNRYLERLRQAEINPVTIPARIKSMLPCPFLPNPVKSINKNSEHKKSKTDIYQFAELTH